MDRERLGIIGTPLALLLIGGAVGWFMRDDGGTSTTAGTAVGLALPTGAALDALAPVRSLPSQPNTMVIDRTRLIGYPEQHGTAVPAGAVVPLTLDSQGSLTPVDANRLLPATAAPATIPPAQPAALQQLDAPAAPPSTQVLPEPTTTAPKGHPGFADPCTTAKGGCPGAAGSVLAAPSPAAPALDPLLSSMPFAASGTYSSMCGIVESGSAPDQFLAPTVRPTIAVVVNQPSTIALSGTWGDGTPLDKLTMVSSPDDEKAWQTAWDSTHTQKSMLECITLSLDDVRAHAAGGRAALSANVLAISATGRIQLSGPLTLTIPLDNEDPPFADQVTIGSLGEQRQTDGTLAASVHVHYAVTDDNLIPKSSRINVRTAKVYGSHAFVENADCAGWANNAQGVNRTAGGEFSIAQEQRTIAGRARSVTVVDGDVALDPTLPGGWNGYVCVQLFAADADGHRLTIALRGAPVRAPRTSTYRVGALLDPSAFPTGWSLNAVWARPDGTPWCSPIDLTPTKRGGTCTTFARNVPDGIRLVLRATDDKGVQRPAFSITVAVNTAYCTPDDPFAAISDGCATGFVQHLRIPLDAKGKLSAGVTVQVLRDAAQGAISNNPSHAWQIDATQSFAN